MYNDNQERINYLHNQNVVLSTENYGCTIPLNTKVINPYQDWGKIAEEFNTNKICVIDNFLISEYALRLRNFYLAINVRHDYYEEYAAINFYKHNIWFSLLSNITNEAQEYISFIKNIEFQKAWAFIYDNQCDGVSIHIDPASITLNLWVTPNECMNLKEGYNGLDIWRIECPKNWSLTDCIEHPEKAIEYMKNNPEKPIEIEYKFNRLVIFNSRYFHKSQPISSKEGYENKKINYTFLYGEV